MERVRRRSGAMSPDTRAVLRIGARTGAVNIGANTVGAVLVFVYLRLVLLPTDVKDPGHTLLLNIVAFAVYIPGTVAVGTVQNVRQLRRFGRWVGAGAPAGPGQAQALAYPLWAVRTNALMWATGALVFGGVNLPTSALLARNIAVAVAYGGLATCAGTYLLAERTLRPLAVLALAGGLPERDAGPGVRVRILLGWIVAALLPLAGTVIAVVLSPQHVAARTVVSVVFIAGVGVVAGLAAVLAAAASVAGPVAGLRRAVGRVTGGDLDATVDVYDASELGRLQAGFNGMVDGLRERARLADLFGRQVGPEVAARALSRGVELGGERREVGVLFVDVVGSTSMAMSVAPEEVVRRLNAFFAVVVAVVGEHGGVVNKFEGDAVLAVFGAPNELPAAARCAVAAGRELAATLAGGELTAAIGVSYGPVVAGNVGSEDRYEYTVIGDAANEAARLSELAKGVPGLLLVSGRAVDAAGEGGWVACGEQLLRGRTEPTALFTQPPDGVAAS